MYVYTHKHIYIFIQQCEKNTVIQLTLLLYTLLLNLQFYFCLANMEATFTSSPGLQYSGQTERWRTNCFHAPSRLSLEYRGGSG